MRSILILAVFGMLLLKPCVSSAETFAECLTRCSSEMTASAANCPPPGDEARALCLQENQETLKDCFDNCPQAAPANTPKDTLTDAPKDTPTDTPKDTPTDTPKDIPKEN